MARSWRGRLSKRIVTNEFWGEVHRALYFAYIQQGPHSLPYRILVIEDNPDNLTLIFDVLTALDYEVVLARDGEEGIRKATEEKPDLILMDLSLPIIDGWTATKTIRALPDTKQIKIIALTAHAMVGDRERALRAGCDDYVSKPIDLRELTSKLAAYLP